MKKYCKDCKKELPIDSFYTNGKPTAGKVKHKPTCKKCENLYWSNRFYSIVEKVMGKHKCSICGYDKCKWAIEFHHKDESTKENELSNIKHYSEEKITKELEKCIMVCSNCHREIHYNEGKL